MTVLPSAINQLNWTAVFNKAVRMEWLTFIPQLLFDKDDQKNESEILPQTRFTVLQKLPKAGTKPKKYS